MKYCINMHKSAGVKLFFAQLLLIGLTKHISAYKTVILIPGLLSRRSHMNGLKDMIEKAHPGTNVTTMDLYPEIESFVPLDDQLSHWKNKVIQIMEESTDGVHLVCHSQGGLICQGIIETVQHNVNTFIALGSPLNGQFGVPNIILQYLPWLKGYLREDVSKYMYKKWIQLTVSFSNYWRDPRNMFQELYLNASHYLPFVVANPKCSRITPEERESRKKNFLKIKQLVLVGGPDDGVIQPWQSSLYGYYDNNYKMLNYTDLPVFTEDWFGLRTLHEGKRLHVHAIPGVTHGKWHDDINVFKTTIEPWLD